MVKHAEDRNITEFLKKIKSFRAKIDSIYLFGSRARGTARENSDYDLLLILKEKEKRIKDQLYEAAVDVLLDTGADISLKIIKKDDFKRMSDLAMPFILNVLKEGIKIG